MFTHYFRRQIGKTRLHSPTCGFYRNGSSSVNTDKMGSCSDSDADDLGRVYKADARSPNASKQPVLQHGRFIDPFQMVMA